MSAGEQLLGRFIEFIISPAIGVILAAGFFLFMWGLVQFLMGLEDGANRKEGLDHMKWGVAGMFVMFSVWGIITLLSATFGLGVGADGSYNPDLSRLNDTSTFKFVE